jgi:hypothetical protein
MLWNSNLVTYHEPFIKKMFLFDLFLGKDINAVMQPITAPMSRESIKIPKKSPTALKNALVSNPPDLDWYLSS